jgi:hypothetical protein
MNCSVESSLSRVTSDFRVLQILLVVFLESCKPPKRIPIFPEKRFHLATMSDDSGNMIEDCFDGISNSKSNREFLFLKVLNNNKTLKHMFYSCMLCILRIR